MEKENVQENTICHVSHLRPLKLKNLVEVDGGVAHICYACRGPCSGEAYTCEPCELFLHATCAPGCPRSSATPPIWSIRSPSALCPPTAVATSSATPAARAATPAASTAASAISTSTSTAPPSLIVSHPSHPHRLALADDYTLPLGATAGACDLCKDHFDPSSQWLYLCRGCDYGGHVYCFAPQSPPASAGHSRLRQAANAQTQANPGNQPLDMQTQLMAAMAAARIRARGEGVGLISLATRGLTGIRITTPFHSYDYDHIGAQE